MRGRCPDLLPIDEVIIAVPSRPRAQRREIGTGAGLGEALAEPVVSLRIFGRDGPFCSGVPNVNTTGPTMLMLNDSGSGAGACNNSSMKM
jgi:hypothetical protein